MIGRWPCLPLLVSLALPHAATAAGVARGEALYASCVACHGAAAQGNPVVQAPALAGLDAAYVERQLHNFRAGVRGADPADVSGAQMRAMAAALADDAAVGDVSAYLATLGPSASPPSAPAGPGADLRSGSNYYQAKCGACHGGKAEGNGQLFAPRLAGQDAAYLKRQYRNFLSGLRGGHPDDRYGRQMKMMAATLPAEKDIDDVLAFIATQADAE